MAGGQEEIRPVNGEGEMYTVILIVMFIMHMTLPGALINYLTGAILRSKMIMAIFLILLSLWEKLQLYFLIPHLHPTL